MFLQSWKCCDFRVHCCIAALPRGADAPPLSERSLKMPARRCTTGPSSAIILPQFLENKDVMWTDVKWSCLVMSFRVCFHDFYMVYIYLYSVYIYIYITFIHVLWCEMWGNFTTLCRTVPVLIPLWLLMAMKRMARCGSVQGGMLETRNCCARSRFTSFHIISPLDSGLLGTFGETLSHWGFRLFWLHLKLWTVDWETTMRQREWDDETEY